MPGIQWGNRKRRQSETDLEGPSHRFCIPENEGLLQWMGLDFPILCSCLENSKG